MATLKILILVQTRSLTLREVAEVKQTRFAEVIMVIEIDQPQKPLRWSVLC